MSASRYDWIKELYTTLLYAHQFKPQYWYYYTTNDSLSSIKNIVNVYPYSTLLHRVKALQSHVESVFIDYYSVMEAQEIGSTEQ